MGVTVSGSIPSFSKLLKLAMNEAPAKAANQSLNHYLDGFEQGGKKTNDSLSGWAERQRKDKTERSTGIARKILVKTGELRRSIDVESVSISEIVLGSDVDYASYHNEGTEIHKQREFLGDSFELDEKNISLIEKIIYKRLK